jgi:tight adherence protein B
VWWLLAAALLLAAVLGLAAGGPLGGVVALFAAAACIRLALGLRASRRRRAFDEHLPDVLAEISSALRAGHGFLQAVQAVAADAPSPIGPELQRVLAEARLGRPLEDALLAAGDRIGSEDFDFVLDAVVVQRQVGGSLAGIFEIVGDSVRQRQQAELKLRALTATGRMSAAVLLGLPIVIALGLTLLNHAYMQPLYDTGTGRMLLGGSIALIAVGSVWLHRIVSEVG